MLNVTINGDQRAVPAGSVAQLLEHLGLHPRLVVVEHNRVILDRDLYNSTAIRDGDVLELVHFVGGG